MGIIEKWSTQAEKYKSNATSWCMLSICLFMPLVTRIKIISLKNNILIYFQFLNQRPLEI